MTRGHRVEGGSTEWFRGETFASRHAAEPLSNGRAQKIDRMMEKFAEKFCQDNPGTFTTADCAIAMLVAIVYFHVLRHTSRE
eukprot:795420-Amphidinium_carterae.1